MAKTPAEPNAVHGLDDRESKPHFPTLLLWRFTLRFTNQSFDSTV